MKKSRKFLFVVPLGILLGTSLFALKPNFNVQKALAEEPVSTEVSEEPTSEEITSISDSEEIVINVDEEVSKISQQAKDFIECVKAICSQPIVIGGVSTTLGALVLFVIGRIFGAYLGSKNKKYEQKIAQLEKKIVELLNKVGIDEQVIEYLKGLIKELIDNTKNIQLREQLEERFKQLENIGKETNEKAKEIVEETVKEIEQISKEVIEEVDNNKEEIKKLFKK